MTTFSLPSQIKKDYRVFVDAMISDLGVNATLEFPPRRISCDSCDDSNSPNIWGVSRTGGPAPANRNDCPNCGGKGFKEEVKTKDITVRVSFDTRKFNKPVGSESIPNADAQIMGSLSDLPDLRQANTIQLVNSREGNMKQKFQLSGEPLFRGIGDKRYFTALLNRV